MADVLVICTVESDILYPCEITFGLNPSNPRIVLSTWKLTLNDGLVISTKDLNVDVNSRLYLHED